LKPSQLAAVLLLSGAYDVEQVAANELADDRPDVDAAAGFPCKSRSAAARPRPM